MIDAKLLELLACPWCVTRPESSKPGLMKGELELQGAPDAPSGLKCKQCGRFYKYENGLLNLIAEA